MKIKFTFISLLLLIFFGSVKIYGQNEIKFDVEDQTIKIGKDSKGNSYVLKHNITDDLKITLVYPPNSSPTYHIDYKVNSLNEKKVVLNKTSENTSSTLIQKKDLAAGTLVITFYDNDKKIKGFTINAVKGSEDKKDDSLTKTSQEEEKATGNIMEDALLLEKYKDGTNLKLVIDILSTHANKNIDGSDLNNVLAEYKENTYIEEYINKTWNSENFKIQTLSLDKNQQAGNYLGNISNISSMVGGLDVTNLADGFARFIVKRTKEELSITFFEKFKKELDDNPNIQTVFPQTYKSLNVIDKEIYMFKAYIQTLREAFKSDLSNLPENLPTIIDNNPDFFNEHLELKASLLSSFYLADQIKNGTHPGIIVEDFPDEDWADVSINQNYRAAFKTIKLFSRSFRNSNGGNVYWLPYSEIKKLFQNDNLLKLYLGLVVKQAQLDNITFEKSDKKTQNLNEIINSAASLPNNINSYRTFIKEIVQKTQTIEIKINELPVTENDSLKFEKYYSIISNTLDLMKKAVKIETLPHFPKLNIKLKEDSNRYFDMAQTAADAAVDVNRKNYTSAIVNIAELFNISSEIYKKNDPELIKLQAKANVLKESFDKQDIVMNDLQGKNEDKEKKELERLRKELEVSITNLKKYIDTNEIKYKDKYEVFFKYGTFMATVTQAKNSQQVEEAIEAFALPTGSARIKRETMFNVALNAYCGLFYGGEKIEGLDNCYKGTYGVTAPIGISISYGKQKVLPLSSLKEYKGHWSHTLFLSIIDIGAITAFRFQDDVTESAPKIELKDIISPGIFYSFGIPKSPLSVNLGYQIGPLLRKVTAADNTYSNSYSRLSIAFVVDIPILNFYTKSK
ncbi:hypothetical protein SAMN05444671_4728 [Flavobacterium sp. CF108]|uniref:hypothetical protein n=1 Tax=unclassified Flavobacterium TaxID=196869 RepID=UPI0008BEA33A|nr:MULTISPECIES: hypothetical protein [unclassified Flavobacterium]SEP24128.1 hypothetical protein SAMN04487978_0216 [Flavobacterium sp. fv08]SHI01515.1 hypothetical protein SAMN05444671_4728 [Flavobacterium sp. CF108]